MLNIRYNDRNDNYLSEPLALIWKKILMILKVQEREGN